MRKLTEKYLRKIPESYFQSFLGKEYKIFCGEISDFTIGKYANNGFLMFKTFCQDLNQTYCDVTEDQLELIESGYYNGNIEYRKYNPGDKLADDEYLLKIRLVESGIIPDGFMSKLKQDGNIPVAFDNWGKGHFTYKDEPPTYVIKEIFKSGWKVYGHRFGVSQNWAKVIHPDGFILEIYLTDLLDLIKTENIINTEIMGQFKWEKNKLIKNINV